MLRNTPEYPDGILNPAGYATMGMVGSGVVLTLMFISSAGLHHLIPTLQRPPSAYKWSIRGTLRGLRNTFTEPVLLPLLLGGIVISTAFSVYGGVQVYLNAYFWGLSTAQISGLSGIWLVGAALGFIAAPVVSRGRDKRNVAMTMLVVQAFVEIAPLALRLLDLFPSPESPFYYPLVAAFVGLDMAFFIVVISMLASMMADVAEWREIASGEREEGTIFSAQSLITKSSAALGVWISGLILMMVAFPTRKGASEVSLQTVQDLALAVIVVFVAFYPFALYFLSRFRIDRTTHKSDLEELERRNALSKTTAT